MDEKGLKQIELANKAGIERSLISSYLSGRYEPKDESLQALAKALDCDPMWLIGYDGIEGDDENAVVRMYRNLNNPDRQTIITLLQFLNDHERRNRDGM